MTNHSLQSTVCFFSLLLALTGCTEQVVSGEEPGPAATALAMLGSSLPTDPEGYLARAKVDVKPDTVYVFVSNFAQTCASPFLPYEDCDGHPFDEWQMMLSLPAQLQTAGPLTLPETGVDDVIALEGRGSNGTCLGTVQADGFEGSVAITSIDATQVTLQLTDVVPQTRIGSTPPSEITGEFKALICP